jgi:hypothetical protein
MRPIKLDTPPADRFGLLLQAIHGVVNVEGQAAQEERGQGRVGPLGVKDVLQPPCAGRQVVEALGDGGLHVLAFYASSAAPCHYQPRAFVIRWSKDGGARGSILHSVTFSLAS